MTHLDEGTIHAWLDGALEAGRAREVEAHVTTCAQCSAAVAEARGLVAGASRILTALDDVPGGVVPKGKPAAPAWGPRAQRQWRAAPWVTGIAAALMLGVGVTQLGREGRKQATSAPPDVTTFERTPVAIAPAAPSTRDARASASDKVAAPTTASRSVAEQVRGAPASSLGATASGTGIAGAVGGAGVGDRTADFSGKGVPGPAATKSPVLLREAERREADLAAAASDVAQEKKGEPVLPLPSPGLVPPAPATPAVMMKDAAGDPARQRARDVTAAGCYRIAPDAVERSKVADAAKAVGAGATPSAARAVSGLAERPSLPEPPMRVQLDTSPMPRGYAVRRVISGERIGYWFRTGDSLRLELLAAGAYTIPTSARAPCP